MGLVLVFSMWETSFPAYLLKRLNQWTSWSSQEDHVTSDFQPLELLENKFLLFKTIQYVVFYYGNPSISVYCYVTKLQSILGENKKVVFVVSHYIKK